MELIEPIINMVELVYEKAFRDLGFKYGIL